jgi:hypothetical protein
MSQEKQSKKTTTKVKSNTKKGSLVKVIVNSDVGKWISPSKETSFSIDAQATFPEINFEIETTQVPPYKWNWKITWAAKVSGLSVKTARGKTLKTFSQTGNFESQLKAWKCDLGKVIGGKLTVEVEAGAEKFKKNVKIIGTNPSKDDAITLLKTIPDTDGFEKILEQESKFKNFIDFDSEPIVAFDNGYGMTQMTNPAPSYEQIWNWKENLKGGTNLYKSKQKEAKGWLSTQKRTYTSEQLRLETWARWNGGSYHVWDEKAKQWVRDPKILADSATGNIGWDNTKEFNKDKTEEELHTRDKDEYKKPPPRKDRKWTYSGIVYADHLNQ